jgi:hypothetical protein
MHLEVLSARLSGAHRRSKRRKFLPQLPGVERMRSTGSQGLVTQGLREAGQRSAMVPSTRRFVLQRSIPEPAGRAKNQAAKRAFNYCSS